MSTKSSQTNLRIALENLAEASVNYYKVFILGEMLRATDNQIEQDFISECQARLVVLGEMKPDPTDDPSFSHRLGK